LDTPCLLLRADVLERNINQMAEFARDAGVALRPHCKTHKSPRIAAMQVEAGAIGITCQKLGEAEVMARAGIEGLLISNQIVGAVKIQRLIALAHLTSVIVAVDAIQNVAALSGAATASGVVLKTVIEVDTGMKRCGAAGGEPTLELARSIRQSPGLEFAGVMGYEGHAVMVIDPAERQQKARQALQVLVDTADLLRQHDIPVPIVSSSGTGTFDTGGGFPGITELQVGSYATMDGRYRAVGVPFECALTVLTTVMSGPRDGVVIADVVTKSITTEFGLPEVVGIPGAALLYLSEEHAKIKLDNTVSLQPGQTIELLPSHGCTTFNLHDQFYVLRGDAVEDVWPVAARGRSQ
jgi:D-serine deaminase-like pyridoxal phosphate-dependent protein